MYIPLTKILLLLRTKIKIFFKRIPTKIHASNEQERKERIRKIGFIPRWLREYLAFYVSQEDVRRGNADIKPLEFVPVSDGRKLRKEKRPPPPFAPIDFVRRLFRSWAWISEFRIRCCPFEGAEEEEIFDHNSLFLFIFLFPFIGNNLLNLTHIRFLLFLQPSSEGWIERKRERDASRFPRRKTIIDDTILVPFYFSLLFDDIRLLGAIRNWTNKKNLKFELGKELLREYDGIKLIPWAHGSACPCHF